MTKSKLFWLLILPLLTVAIFLFLRLSQLNAIPVFVDEAIYVRWSQVMRSEPSLRFIPLSDGKQPLFMWGTIPFLKYINDPLIAGRMVSVISGLGSLIGIYILTFLVFESLPVAALSGLAYTILPFTVFFDRMALADSLLAMFGVWSLVFSIYFAKTLKLEIAMLLGFALGGSLLTKSPAVFFYLWTILSIVFFFRLPKTINHLFRLVLGLLAAFIISQMIYSILRLGPGFQMIGSRNQDYVYTLSEVIKHPTNPLFANIKTTTTWFWNLLTPTTIAVIIFAFLGQKNKKSLIFFLLISTIPLLAQGLIAKVYTSRYILFAVYPLVPLIGVGYYWFITRKGIIIKLLTVAIILTPVVISCLYVFQPKSVSMPYDMRSGYLEEWTAGWGQKEVATYLITEEKKGNKIVVFTEGYFGTLPDGLQIYTEGRKNITIVGSTPIAEILPTGLTNTSSDNQRYFVINKSRNKLPASELAKLDLIAEYPKPTRLDGTQEILQFYRLR